MDIVNDLSKFQNLLVIDSGSVSGDKGETASIEDVSRELGVRYVLEGSVLKRGDRVRINAKLIDSATGQQLWAERFDEAAESIWDIQDEITGRIVRTLALRITEIEQQRVLAKSTDNLEAYEFTLRGRAASCSAASTVWWCYAWIVPPMRKPWLMRCATASPRPIKISSSWSRSNRKARSRISPGSCGWLASTSP